MPLDTVIFEQRDGVAHVTLNRPDKLNALNVALVDDLRATAARIAGDSACRAVLLTGAGRAFCSGADLARGDFFPDTTDGAGGSDGLGESIGTSLRESFNPMISAWYDLPVPVVVAVNGIAAGAGASLALMGDIVLAARSATFLQLFAPKLGLMPDLGSTFHLPRLVGTARAKGLALLGDALSAADAERWGLIWGCIDDDALAAHAQGIAQRFASGPTQAFRKIKQIFNDEPRRTLAEQMALEADVQADLGNTRDFAEGLLAFRGKRMPAFKGM